MHAMSDKIVHRSLLSLATASMNLECDVIVTFIYFLFSRRSARAPARRPPLPRARARSLGRSALASPFLLWNSPASARSFISFAVLCTELAKM